MFQKSFLFDFNENFDNRQHFLTNATQPDELVDFALAYFTRLKAKRNAIAAENNNLSDESMLSEDEEFGEWAQIRNPVQ